MPRLDLEVHFCAKLYGTRGLRENLMSISGQCMSPDGTKSGILNPNPSTFSGRSNTEVGQMGTFASLLSAHRSRRWTQMGEDTDRVVRLEFHLQNGRAWPLPQPCRKRCRQPCRGSFIRPRVLMRGGRGVSAMASQMSDFRSQMPDRLSSSLTPDT